MMSEYGAYVWSAYGITLCILGLNIFFALREKRRIHLFIKKYSHES